MNIINTNNDYQATKAFHYVFCLIYSVLQISYALCRNSRLLVRLSVKSTEGYRTCPLIVTASFEFLTSLSRKKVGRDSSVGIATRYGLDGPGIESRWGARFSALV